VGLIRTLRRLPALVACCVGILACNTPSEPFQVVPIKSLWQSREAYLGKRVRVDGTLKLFLKGEPKEHYAIESSDVFRVGVSGVKQSELEAYLGAKVRAEGRFRFNEKRGGYLEGAVLTGL